MKDKRSGLRRERDSHPFHPCNPVSKGQLSSGGVWGNAPSLLVETIGFEPMTPCLQSRCSTN